MLKENKVYSQLNAIQSRVHTVFQAKKKKKANQL